MKTRTPNKNALTSLIPFYGISSFWYLGKKLGVLAWLVNLEITVGMYVFFMLYIKLDLMYSGIIVGIVSSEIQFFIVKHLTEKRNKMIVK